MGRFVRNNNPVRVDLGEGDWVDIKPQFTMGDRSYINESIVTGGIRNVKVVNPATGEEEDQTEMGQMSIGASNVATLLRGVVAWGGPGFCTRMAEHEDKGTPHSDDHENGCHPQKITHKNLLDLDDATGRLLLEEIAKRNIAPIEGSKNPTSVHGTSTS